MSIEKIYSTGNAIVDENAKLDITGNIIPQAWYQTITRDNGKPNLTAIIILADIVYWYKPTEIRDEVTGQVVELKRSSKQICFKEAISRSVNSLEYLKRRPAAQSYFWKNWEL